MVAWWLGRHSTRHITATSPDLILRFEKVNHVEKQKLFSPVGALSCRLQNCYSKSAQTIQKSRSITKLNVENS